MLFFLLALIVCIFSSCYKEPMDYSKAINELRAQVNNLQNRSDSLANALKITNSTISNVTKTVDSIKYQLTTINTVESVKCSTDNHQCKHNIDNNTDC